MSPPTPQATDAVSEDPESHLTFQLTVRKTAGASLGLDLAYSSEADWTRHGLFVARVLDNGAVAAWNAQSEEPRRLRAGDFVFKVNDVESDTISIVQEIKAKRSVTIHAMRVLTPGSPGSKLPSGSGDPFAFGGHPMGPAPTITQDWDECDNCGRDLPAKPQMQIPKTVGVRMEPPSGVSSHVQVAPPLESPSQQVSPRVEALLPKLSALSDAALASLVCVALERRPIMRNLVLADP